jgi:hypothetical protein
LTGISVELRLSICSILIVQSRALGVQGKGRFLALGALGFWEGEKNLYYEYKVEWRKLQDSVGLLYTGGGR